VRKESKREATANRRPPHGCRDFPCPPPGARRYLDVPLSLRDVDRPGRHTTRPIRVASSGRDSDECDIIAVMRGIIIGLALALVACTNQIDSSKVEASIHETSKTKGLPLASISCPAGVKIEKGRTFKCNVTDAQGTAATVTVTMTDNDGTISWDLDGKMVDMKKLGDDMEAKISAAGGKDVDVKCPSKTFIAKKGCKFTCDATAGTDTLKIAFTCNDDQGDLDYKIER
jgi:hypothetical protein